MIEELAPGIWTVQAPLRLLGAAFGTRMTLVRLGENDLVLIAPCPIDEVLGAEIDALGRVTALIAPNAFHHFYFPDAVERYPEAARFLAEGVAEKLGAKVKGAKTLESSPDPIWKAELSQCLIEGAPAVNEVVFYHGASGTLILTDLCFHFDPPPTGWTGLMIRIFGAHGRLATSRLMRLLFKDREKVRGSLKKILAWDFDRIVVTHGSIVERDGHRLLAEATADL